jgi:hypothetical protein
MAPELELLEFLLAAEGLAEPETVRDQVRRALVHEVEAGRYFQLSVPASCPPVTSRWTGLYVNAFARVTECEGVEALLFLTEGVASALEFCYSPDIRLEQLPAIAEWAHLSSGGGK